MAVTLPIPPGTAIIIDDEGKVGASLVDPITGTFIGYFNNANDFLTRAESGCAMLDGTICGPNNFGVVGDGLIQIYDINVNLIVNVNVGTIGDSFPRGVTTDQANYFYVISANGSDDLFLYKLNKSGTILETWNLGINGATDPVACAVDRNNSFIHLDNCAGGIDKFDLNTNTKTTVASINLLGLVTDVNGNFYATIVADNNLHKYDSNFTLIGSVAAGPATYNSNFIHLYYDDLHVVSWAQKNSGIPHPDVYSAFRIIKLSDLSVVSDISNVPTERNSNFLNPATVISNSCPLIITGIGSSGTPSNECGGGSLVGGDGGGGNAGGEWCTDCVSSDTPPPQNWPADLLSDLISVGINNCWEIGFIYAVEPLFNARGFTGQVNSAGQLRGRFYEGYPVPNFNKYFDTNGPDCQWLYTPHGL